MIFSDHHKKPIQMFIQRNHWGKMKLSFCFLQAFNVFANDFFFLYNLTKNDFKYIL